MIGMGSLMGDYNGRSDSGGDVVRGTLHNLDTDFNHNLPTYFVGRLFQY